MRVNKAKRRWLRWARYMAATGTRTGSSWYGGYHRGSTKAYEDVSKAKRYAPIGLRSPYYDRWMER
jgi:hypothetical protein